MALPSSKRLALWLCRALVVLEIDPLDRLYLWIGHDHRAVGRRGEGRLRRLGNRDACGGETHDDRYQHTIADRMGIRPLAPGNVAQPSEINRTRPDRLATCAPHPQRGAQCSGAGLAAPEYSGGA